MVSYNHPLSPTRRKNFPQSLMEGLSKKRKFDEEASENVEILGKSTIKTMKFMPLSELHLDSPLPLEWQRCLDIKSGQIYFYNTKTNKRTSADPRLSQEFPTSPAAPQMSLDLELNLPCGSSPTKINQTADNFTKLNSSITSSSSYTSDHLLNLNSNAAINVGGLSRSPSWLAFEEEQDQEMVAAVCKKCHMLVMMCKSSPSCPNCKFMHPIEQSTTPNLFKRTLSLLC